MLHLLKVYLHGTFLMFTRRRPTFRRFVSVFGFASLLAPVRVGVAITRALDGLLFPGYRKQPITKPLYIIANPRSGTTYLHQLLSLDEERFTGFRLWHTMLPSVVFYKLVSDILAPIDHAIGEPIGRALTALDRSVFGGWDTMHPTGVRRLEEPETIWIFAGITPSVHFLFPFIEEMSYLHFLGRIADWSRRSAVRFYVESVRRHLYAMGPKKTFLNKEVFYTGRFEFVSPHLPDARYVHIVRHPYESIPSFLSMFSLPWKFHTPEIERRSDVMRRFGKIVFDYYKCMLQIQRELPPERLITIRYDELVRDPIGTVELIYERFGMEMTEEFRVQLRRALREPRGEGTEHRYSLEEFGLTKEEVYVELAEVFEAYGFEPEGRRTEAVR